jgi:uncharacterized radical SAM superfamily Fe-S cluster-containing enzyme
MNAPLRRSRPYIFWGQTQSLCETCLALVPTKIQILDDEVWYEKRCKQHGVQSTLVSTDAAYWRRCKEFTNPAINRWRFSATPNSAARSTAGCVRITNSIPAWR